MAKNTGKRSENTFEAVLDGLGKRAFYLPLVDAAEIYGRVGKTGKVRAQPSDYVVTLDGSTFYAEVKSTQDPTAFRFSLLRTKQSAAAVMILGAGGDYFVFIHRLLTNTWYRLPYAVILDRKAQGGASINWSEMQGFKWI